MAVFTTLKVFLYFNIICTLLLILLFHIRSVNKMATIPSSIINLSKSHQITIKFREQLIKQRLETHFQMYDSSTKICNEKVELDAKLNQSLSVISKLLVELRGQIVPYPNEYFYGRGIVLTVGLLQMKYAKINLKMMELSHIQLPIEVEKIS